ncbi:MAG: tail fiber protein [Desulfobacteraceae bacterium]|jgi:hypothetical protein
MKKSNLMTLILTTIVTLFLLTDFTLSQEYNNTLEAADGSPTDAIFVDNDGNVGIGITSPDAALHIDKSQNSDSLFIGGASNTSYSAINFRTDETITAWVFAAGSSYSSWSLTGSLNIYNEHGPIAFQTNGGNNRMIIDTIGNVGIGTTDPESALHIDKPQNTDSLYIGGASNTSYSAVNFRTDETITAWVFAAGSSYSSWSLTGALNIYNEHGPIAFQTNGGNNRMIIDTIGNVGIGTINPANKLDVNGTIRAKEVKVESTWSDFVFEEDYSLPSLNQVESYIKENKHLPDIPSAKQVEEEGISVSEMMKKQMQKIEELTLYVIELKKELTKIKKNMN